MLQHTELNTRAEKVTLKAKTNIQKWVFVLLFASVYVSR